MNVDMQLFHGSYKGLTLF